jgi:hypothetical protein
MGTKFWVRRFLTVFALAFLIIAVAQLLKGHAPAYAGTQAALWSFIATSVFTTSRIYQSRRKQHCALCRDTPEMRGSDSGDPA